MYRLAVISDNGGRIVAVEMAGQLFRLDSVVGTDAIKAIGDAPYDLMPLLLDWVQWDRIISAGLHEIAHGSGKAVTDDVVFHPPIAAPGKIVCIGANYHDHIAEMAIPMSPAYPFSFLKPANNTLRGSGATVAVPATVEMMDWEAELAIVIGCECRSVTASDALPVIAGYANFNDLSARDWLATRPAVGVDWVRHKAFDGFAPMGPYVLPARFVPDPQALSVKLSVNGVVKQDSSTAQMVFGVAAIIEHLSSIMTLYPGDIIATGTPAGVGAGRKPPEFLKSGDEIRMSIGSLGELLTIIS
jgi:2-keto-4-pentenoate hydratase/2-oxohepta-3-ene-1,7-dioic acid hydratase in catechol pathway